ncbi:MAG: hypothetical protein PWQ55_788 [Chloroflexota bacterium]|nr:hypothetical protein [Chloroflexota bacterium]
MNNAIIISIIGAGMVFVGLILLWFMMDILVRLTSREKAPQPEAQAADALPGTSQALPSADENLKRQAAAAAVAIALAQASARKAQARPQKTDALSPWQSAHRLQQLNQSNALPRRK